MPKIVDHDARRREISGVAAALIARGGLEAATIREIAQVSGYSKGVVEHYFDNKEQLISGALDWANQRYELRVEKATAGLSGLPALRQRIQATLPMDRAVRDEWKVRLVFWSMAAIQDDLRRRQAVRFRRAVKYFETDITAATHAGEMSDAGDPANLARRLVNMTMGISIAALHNRAQYTRQFLFDESAFLIDQFVVRASHHTG